MCSLSIWSVSWTYISANCLELREILLAMTGWRPTDLVGSIYQAFSDRVHCIWVFLVRCTQHYNPTGSLFLCVNQALACIDQPPQSVEKPAERNHEITFLMVPPFPCLASKRTWAFCYSRKETGGLGSFFLWEPHSIAVTDLLTIQVKYVIWQWTCLY